MDPLWFKARGSVHWSSFRLSVKCTLRWYSRLRFFLFSFSDEMKWMSTYSQRVPIIYIWLVGWNDEMEKLWAVNNICVVHSQPEINGTITLHIFNFLGSTIRLYFPLRFLVNSKIMNMNSSHNLSAQAAKNSKYFTTHCKKNETWLLPSDNALLDDNDAFKVSPHCCKKEKKNSSVKDNSISNQRVVNCNFFSLQACLTLKLIRFIFDPSPS